MFTTLDQYVDFTVRCVERHSGSCVGSSLLGVVTHCVVTFGTTSGVVRSDAGGDCGVVGLGCGSGAGVSSGLVGRVVGECAGGTSNDDDGRDVPTFGGAVGATPVVVEGSPGEPSALCASVGVRGKHYEKNRRKRIAGKLARLSAKRKGYDSGCCVSSDDSAGSVRTVGTRTGVEIEAVQTLAARRVAENKRAEVEAKVAAALAEHKLRALGDKGRTAVVERLAAARYEQRINEARLRAQKSFSASEDSLKSLGSMGSAGELYAKQAIKKSRDDAKTLKYVQDQASLLLEHASPEVRQMVAEMPAPVYDDEFEVFGDCPSDFDDEQREAYYADLNRANFELGQVRVEGEGHREATPEELLRIKEELAALSVY